MDHRSRVEAVIHRVVDELNAQLPKPQRLEKSPETVLVGERARLDSLGLVNLVVALEQRIEDELGATVVLTEDPELLSEGGPCSTLGRLADHLTELLTRRESHV